MTDAAVTSDFSALGLCAELVLATAAQGFISATPVQVAVIPAVLAGRDVLAGAETGSGKTAAFALPLLQRLGAAPSARPAQARGNHIRALILAPTRELAAQIGTELEAYARYLPTLLKVVVACGGAKINPQMMALRGGADVLLATPGRLLDLHDQGAIDLRYLDILVLDEADRLLSLGFAEELTAIRELLPEKRQTLFFSATFPEIVLALTDAWQQKPLAVEVAARAEVMITQRVITVDSGRKAALLIHLLKPAPWSQVLIFASAKHTCNRLQQKLGKGGIHAGVWHGDLSQGARNQVLQDFRDGRLAVLIATDVAARGIDIKGLPCVINVELPRSPADYVHRIGRTGRAGEAGLALSLICPDEYAHFKVIEKRMKQRLVREQIPGFIVTEAETPAASSPASKPAE